MSGIVRICSLGLVACLAGGGALRAQARDAWLMQNYRFTGPPPPGRPTDPVVSELRDIQNALLSILRKARFAEDYETALFTAQQAAANAQLIGVVNQRLEAAAEPGPNAGLAGAGASAPTYTIVFKDRTTETATRYWTDGPMLHYITRQGAHVQVRLDLVDAALSNRLNRESHPELHLPE